MSNFDKISILLGVQLMAVISLVGAFWVGEGFNRFKAAIPVDELNEHQNRLGWIPPVLGLSYVVLSLCSDWSKLPWVHVAECWLFLLMLVSLFARAVITLTSRKVVSRRLKQMAVIETAFLLVGMACLSAILFLTTPR